VDVNGRMVRMRKRVVLAGLVVGLAGLLVALTAAGGCALPPHTSSSPPRDSGVKGMVTLGPISPVEQVGGPPNERPYAATIDVVAKGTTTVVATTRSGNDGRFTVRLAPGDYTLIPRSTGPSGMPHAAPIDLHVAPHAFTAVTIAYDSGIR
jgi:hypothetical protein